MSSNKEVIEFADNIDFSDVDKSDRTFMREILMGILRFHDTMPPLQVGIYPTTSEYNITITGWNQHISGKQLHRTFLDPHERDDTFNRILDYTIVPTPDDDRPYIKFKVSRDGHIRTIDKMKK